MTLTKQQEDDIKNVAKKVFQDSISKDEVFTDIFAAKIADIVFSKLSDNINKLIENKIEHIVKDNQQLKDKVEDLEQKLKLSQLRIYGVKEKKNENVNEAVNVIFKDKLKLNENDYAYQSSYRVGGHNATNKKPRVIIVTFSSMMHRNTVFFKKKELKGTKITITEDLIKSRYELLMLAREKLGRENVWTRDGKIISKVNGHKHIFSTKMGLELFLGEQ